MNLVSAEILKLVRRRGTMAWCAILTIGSVLVAWIVLVSLHAANPARSAAPFPERRSCTIRTPGRSSRATSGVLSVERPSTMITSSIHVPMRGRTKGRLSSSLSVGITTLTVGLL